MYIGKREQNLRKILFSEFSVFRFLTFINFKIKLHRGDENSSKILTDL